MTRFAEAFKNLEAIAYKDIYINEMLVRILGIHYMPAITDWNVKRHKHSFFEFHYVTENNVLSTINNLEYEISANHFYIMPPGSYHSHRQKEGQSHVGFALRWEFSDPQKDEVKMQHLNIKKLRKSLESTVTSPVFDEKGKVLDSMVNILIRAENINKSESSLLELQLYFILLLINISEFYKESPAIGNMYNNDTYLENSTVENALRFIDENFDEDIDVKDIANSVHLSYSHLSRLFKKYTGGSINLHLNKIRLIHAQRLLLCTNRPLAQIAHETGFSDENYFCSTFKKYYGVPPGSFRSGRKTQLSD